MGVSQPDYCDSFLSSVTFSNLALNPFDLYLKKKKKSSEKRAVGTAVVQEEMEQ